MNKSTESDLKSHLIWPRAEIEDATAQYIEDCTELDPAIEDSPQATARGADGVL